jgi:hypothetical protein
MEYQGNIYAKIGGKYVKIGHSDDYDAKKYTEQDIIEAAYFFATYKIASSREVFDKDIYTFIDSLNKQD